MKAIAISVLALVVLSGCLSLYKSVDTSQLRQGMTTAQVVELIGHPWKVNTTVIGNNRRQQWVYVYYDFYANAHPDTYLYFENDRLTAWQF